jgi:hypothetical protein
MGAVLVVVGSAAIVAALSMAADAGGAAVPTSSGVTSAPEVTGPPTPSSDAPGDPSPATTSEPAPTIAASAPIPTATASSSSAVPSVPAVSPETTSTSSTVVEEPPAIPTPEGTIVAAATVRLLFVGLCASQSPQGFTWAVGNLGDEPVEVEVRQGPSVVGTFVLAPGDVAGFGTAGPETAEATVDGVVVATAPSSDLPCPAAPRGVGVGGVCFDPAIGYMWILGNGGDDTIVAEVRLDGDVVGVFPLEPLGLAGFTTASPGTVHVLVDGLVVAEGEANPWPCDPSPLAIQGECYEDGVGYRWSIYALSPDAPTSVEVLIDGVSQGIVVLTDGWATLTTGVGGEAELAVDGTVVATGESSDVVCDSPIGLWSTCTDMDGSVVWSVLNVSETETTVDLDLDGVRVETVTLDPFEERQVVTPDGATLEARADGKLVGRADRSDEPCVSVWSCVSPAVGTVWQIVHLAPRPVRVVVRFDGARIGAFDLSEGSPFEQFVTGSAGSVQLFVDGVLAVEQASSDEPCPEVAVEGVCFDAAHGFAWVVWDPLGLSRSVELRLNGVSLGVFEVDGFRRVHTARGGRLEVVVDGQVVAAADSSDEPCSPRPPTPPPGAGIVTPTTVPTSGLPVTGADPAVAVVGLLCLVAGVLLRAVASGRRSTADD